MGHSLDIPWTEPSELRGTVNKRAVEFRECKYHKPVRNARRLAALKSYVASRGRTLSLVPKEDTTPVPRQCTMANHVTGARCRSISMIGQMVCQFHGGKKPLAKFNAKQRLAAMCEPAMAVLNEMMTDKGVEDEVRLKAAIATLDRAGFSPKMQLTLKDKRERLVGELNREELIERGRRIMERLEESRHEVIEGEVLEP